MVDPVVGQADFESAHRQFQAAGDASGALLACAGVLEASYFRLDEQESALPWIQEMDRLLTQFPVLPPEIELRVIHGLKGVWLAQPQHPMLPRWAARAADLMRTLPDARDKAGLIAFATGYYMWAGEFALAHSALDHFDLDRKLIEGAPVLAIGACVSMSSMAWQNAEHEEAYKLMRLAQTVADESGVHILDSWCASQRVYTALSSGDVAHAEEELARIRSMLNPRRRLDINHYHFLHAGVLLLRGKLAAALDIARREVPVAEALGAPFLTVVYRIQLAQLLILDGQYDEARSQLAAALEFARAMPSHILKFQALMATAWAWFRKGSHAQGHEALRDGLTIGRRQNYMNCHPLWIPEMMTELFARALETGIETDYVHRFIRKRGLEPGKHYTEEWPWPIRIHTLGRFELRLDGEPVPSTGKTKQRVLDLLKAIVAFGPHGAAMEALTAALWPDAEGDAARDALDVTLHRLRKLLGVERAIVVADGRVSLNSQCVWVDVGAFERAVEETEPGDNRDLSPEAIGRVLKLYGGHFLQGDGERHWLLTQRERLRSKFLRYVERCGDAWEGGRQIGSAIELYRRALELEPLAETLYHRLMLCYMRDGRNAEALEVCRRCRQMLSIVLGVRPSAETEALHAELTRTPFLPGK
jgi:DNA-binding SARP family transcriptional activator